MVRRLSREGTTESEKLLSVWNWLPVFYVVAQTEHLPTASRRLRVSVSALSRTIRLLEESLGRPLFRRAGRSLELNAYGEGWLAALERSFGVLTSEFDRLTAVGLSGALHVGVLGPISQGVILPALRQVQSQYPGLVLYLQSCPDHDRASRLLLAGDFDLVLRSELSSEESLSAECLGQFTNSVFCGAGHPLFYAPAPAEDAVLSHAFVGYLSRHEVWPAALRRKVEIYVNQEATALQLCLSGQLLAILPDIVAHPYVKRAGLRRLPMTGLSATPLQVLWRTGDESSERVGAVIKAMRGYFAGLSADGGPPRLEAGTVAVGDDASVWQLGDSLLICGKYAAASHAYRAALSQMRGARSEKATCLLRRGRIALMRGRYVEVARECRGALALDPAPPACAIAESMLAIMHCYRGEISQAEESLQRARAQLSDSATDLDSVRARAALMRAEGSVLVLEGNPAAAAGVYSRGAEICREVGDRWDYSIALGNIADAHLHAGNAARALDYFYGAAEEKQQIGDRWGECYVHHGRAFLHLCAEQIDHALREAANGLKLAVDVSDLKLIAMLNILLGRALLTEPDFKSARRAFRIALSAATGCKARQEIIQASIGLADVALRSGDTRSAAECAASARAGAARCGSKDALAAALLACAAVAAQRGDSAQAAEQTRAARQLVPRAPRFYGFWFTVGAPRLIEKPNGTICFDT